MPKLAYRTKENKEYHGKMKIYFCSAKKDFERFFETIAGEVFCQDPNYDYAIWYDEEETDSELDEAWYLQLKEMSMFIVPITSSFFDAEQKIQKELETAIEYHVPILPLLAEKGIETLFNEKYGDLHALSIVDGTDNEGFQNNFKRFLDSVLLGEKLLEEIRGLQEDYIFFSYRKKDREQAKKLMKQIHEEDGCEEIAIWYDEYLAPGENFDEYIEERLRNSKVFVLAVTPHILEDKNYIITTEYKIAKEKREDDGYEILPIEMIALSEQEKAVLKEKYEDLPECIYREDKSAIRAWLQQMFWSSEKKNRRYYYLLGIGYLKGINRERDVERAEKILAEVAKQKETDAIRRLVSMYQYGDGVKRNRMKEIYWREILVDKLRKAYEGDRKQAEKLEDLIWESMELGQLYYLNKQYKDACKIYETSLLLLAKQKHFTPDLLKGYIELMLNYIELKEQTGTGKSEIKNLLMQCKELRNAAFTLIRKGKNASYVRSLYMVRLKEAELNWKLGEYLQAEKIYKETIENFKQLTFNKEAGVYYSDLIHVYQQRAELRIELGQMEGGEKDLEEAIRLNKEWEDWKDNERVQYNFSLNYEKMGELYWKRYGKEQLDKVAEYFEDAITCLKKAMGGENKIGILLELVTLYRRLSDVRKEESEVNPEQWNEAESLLLFALEELENISSKIDQSEVYLCISECYGDLADMYFERYANVLEADEDTTKEFESVETYANLACSYAEKTKITIANAIRRQNILNKCYQYLAVGNRYTTEKEDVAKSCFEKALEASTHELVKDETDFILAAEHVKGMLEELK